MSISLTWHGHATFSLNINGINVVVDPFFTGNPSAVATLEEVETDYILLTHGHGDHVGDTIAMAQRYNAKVVANFEIANWVNEQGHANTHPQHIGGGWNHSFGRVKFTPAIHGSGLPDGSYGGSPAGLLITADNKNIYISGDTALFSDMSLIGNVGLDLAILCIGDNFTMGPDDSIEAIKYLNPKAVIPCHYNTWPLIAVDIGKWADRVSSETSAELYLLEVGEILTL